MESVLGYLPQEIRVVILDFISRENCEIEEIRLRTGKPLGLKIGQVTKSLDYIVKQQEVLQAFEKICENSVYSYRKQICDGYITIRGGNRVGIVGSAVVDNGQIININ